MLKNISPFMDVTLSFTAIACALLFIFFSCQEITNSEEYTVHYSVTISDINTNEKLSDVKVTFTNEDLDKKHQITDTSGHVELSTTSLSNMLSFEKEGYLRLDTLDNATTAVDSAKHTYFRIMHIKLLAETDTLPEPQLIEVIQAYQDSLNVLIARIDSLGDFVNNSLSYYDSIHTSKIRVLDSLAHLLDSLNKNP